jgi:hypothetical protein
VGLDFIYKISGWANYMVCFDLFGNIYKFYTLWIERLVTVPRLLGRIFICNI